MKKCKVCGGVLNGLVGKIKKIFFNQPPPGKNQDVSNKGVNKAESNKPGKKISESTTREDEKYQCPICKRMILQSHAIEHIKTEEYLMGLISKDHPKWSKKDPVCKECIDYYRKLIEDAEI
jgi:hypothetical protein